jgi:hypothetical protein
MQIYDGLGLTPATMLVRSSRAEFDCVSADSCSEPSPVASIKSEMLRSSSAWVREVLVSRSSLVGQERVDFLETCDEAITAAEVSAGD